MNRTFVGTACRRPFLLASLTTLLLLLLVELCGQTARANTPADAPFTGGVIDVDTTLPRANSPYIITTPIHVTSQATLTIEPGAELRFSSSAELRVEGGLQAQGDHIAQIVFTNLTGSSGARWPGVVVVQPTGDVRLRSVRVHNALAGLAVRQQDPALARPAGRVSIQDSLFAGNGTGIEVDYTVLTGVPRLNIRNNLIASNDIGVRVIALPRSGVKLKLNRNSIAGNTIGLVVGGPGTLKAQQQWWGASSGPRACGAPPAPGMGDSICGERPDSVEFTPWSKVPTGRVLLAPGQGQSVESALGRTEESDEEIQASSVATVTIPPGAFTEPVDLLIAGQPLSETITTRPVQPGLHPTHLSLEITAMASNREVHHFANDRSLTLVISYASEAELNGADPANLMLFYWDETIQAWSFGGFVTTVDPANRRITVQLRHLSRMIIMEADIDDLFLPMVMR